MFSPWHNFKQTGIINLGLNAEATVILRVGINKAAQDFIYQGAVKLNSCEPGTIYVCDINKGG